MVPPPQVLGSSSPDQDQKGSETDFGRSFIRDHLVKQTTCIHFLDNPIPFTGEITPPADKIELKVKQLHLAQQLSFCLPSNAVLEDLIMAYDAEMARIGEAAIPRAEQRWLHKGKPLLDQRIALSSLSSDTLHLVRKTTNVPTKSESDLLASLRTFARDRNTDHVCNDPQCLSSITYLLNHLKE